MATCVRNRRAAKNAEITAASAASSCATMRPSLGLLLQVTQ
jgi:hypothetical protein